eukprot:gene2122-2820_t
MGFTDGDMVMVFWMGVAVVGVLVMGPVVLVMGLDVEKEMGMMVGVVVVGLVVRPFNGAPIMGVAVGVNVVGLTVIGGTDIGEVVVGERLVGLAVEGATVGDWLKGAAVMGLEVAGDSVGADVGDRDGACVCGIDVGMAVVGTIEGEDVVGAAEGMRVVGDDEKDDIVGSSVEGLVEVVGREGKAGEMDLVAVDLVAVVGLVVEMVEVEGLVVEMEKGEGAAEAVEVEAEAVVVWEDLVEEDYLYDMPYLKGFKTTMKTCFNSTVVAVE